MHFAGTDAVGETLAADRVGCPRPIPSQAIGAPVPVLALSGHSNDQPHVSDTKASERAETE